MPSTAPPRPPAPVWREVGRPSPGETQDWATWLSPLGGDGGDAFYRSLVLADGAVTVTVDLQSRHQSGTRTVHRGRCGLPRDPGQTVKRVRLLLAAADRAAAEAAETHRGQEGTTAGHKGLLPHCVPEVPRNGTRDGGAATASSGTAERTREHAHGEAATAA